VQLLHHMLHTFNNEHDILIWSFSYPIRRFEDSQNLFAAQCVWWLVSLTNLTDLVEYYCHYRTFPSDYNNHVIQRGRHPAADLDASKPGLINNVHISRKHLIKDLVLESDLLPRKDEQSTEGSEELCRKASGRISKKRIQNQSSESKRTKLRHNKKQKPGSRSSSLEDINTAEIKRRRESGECLRCAWPADRKGTHQVRKCRRAIKLDNCTAPFPVKRQYTAKNKIVAIESSNTDSSEDSDWGRSSRDLILPVRSERH
jgi:hypothetical protein